MNEGTVAVTVDQGIARLTWSNPSKRNALTASMFLKIRDELNALEGNSVVRVVLVQGEAGIFSSGYAINEIPTDGVMPDEDEIELACAAIEQSRLPVIAVIAGLALGAALELACACDWRFVTEDSRLGIPAAKLGIVYSWRGTARLLKVAGADWTRWLLFTGDVVSGTEAVRIGLASQCFPDLGTLDAQANRLASKITSRSPLSISGSKQTLRELERMSPVSSEVTTELDRLRLQALKSSDFSRARAAFVRGEQAPEFEGR